MNCVAQWLGCCRNHSWGYSPCMRCSGFQIPRSCSLTQAGDVCKMPAEMPWEVLAPPSPEQGQVCHRRGELQAQRQRLHIINRTSYTCVAAKCKWLSLTWCCGERPGCWGELGGQGGWARPSAVLGRLTQQGAQVSVRLLQHQVPTSSIAQTC